MSRRLGRWWFMRGGFLINNPPYSYTYCSTPIATTISTTTTRSRRRSKSIISFQSLQSSDHSERRSISKGDIISLNDILFTKNRDYVIRNNNQQVKAEQLEGKVIGIYFLPQYYGQLPLYTKWNTAMLKDVYNDLQPLNNFEVVMVANSYFDTSLESKIPSENDPKKHFEDEFSHMPWTAIPYSDVTSRKHIQQRFGVFDEQVSTPIMYIIDQTGMVLQYRPWKIFVDYGALGFPFSDKRLKIIRTDDFTAKEQPSLRTLLGSPERDYVISNKGDKVPIHTLEDKVVAIYFYHPDICKLQTQEELKLVYEELAKIKKIFEVVLVYIKEPLKRHDWKSEESYWETLKNMPWLALPYEDNSYKKLRRVFEYEWDDLYKPNIVIFGPHADYIEPCGYYIMNMYGTPAYPFTRKKAAELEVEKVKELKLEMLWDPNTVFRRNDGSPVSVSQLSGKRVMLVLERLEYEDLHKFEFLRSLKERYLQKKGTADEFEVISILISNSKSFLISKHVLGDIPWLVLPASELIYDLVSSDIWFGQSTDTFFFWDGLPIFAFDLDGKLVRKTMFPKLEDLQFPFYAGSLEEETLSQLIRVCCWGYDNLPRGGANLLVDRTLKVGCQHL